MKMNFEKQTIAALSSLVSTSGGQVSAFLTALLAMMQLAPVRGEPGQCEAATVWREDKKDQGVHYGMTIVTAVMMVGALIGYALMVMKMMRLIFPATEKKEVMVQTDVEELPDCELYVTQYGQRYHRRRDCGGLASARSPNSVTACRVCMR